MSLTISTVTISRLYPYSTICPTICATILSGVRSNYLDASKRQLACVPFLRKSFNCIIPGQGSIQLEPISGTDEILLWRETGLSLSISEHYIRTIQPLSAESNIDS